MTYREAAKRYLTPPDCERFITNMENQRHCHRLPDDCCEKHHFVDHGLNWARTPEGRYYWSNLHERMKQ